MISNMLSLVGLALFLISIVAPYLWVCAAIILLCQRLTRIRLTRLTIMLDVVTIIALASHLVASVAGQNRVTLIALMVVIALQLIMAIATGLCSLVLGDAPTPIRKSDAVFMLPRILLVWVAATYATRGYLELWLQTT